MTGTIADPVDGQAPGSAAQSTPRDRAAEEAARQAARAFRRRPAHVVGTEALVTQWRRAVSLEARARSGEDPEDLHKMRVATRRFRAALLVFGPSITRVAPTASVSQLSEDAATIADALGEVRDRDVFVLALQKEAATAPYADLAGIERLIGWRSEEREAARARLCGVLDGPAMARVTAQVESTLAPLSGMGAETKTPKKRRIARHAPKLLAKRLRTLRRLEPALVAALPDDLHRARIAAKKLRYAAEFLAAGYPTALPPLALLAMEIQDALGEVHDLDVHAATLVGDIERMAEDPTAASETAAVARLLRRWLERRDAALATFRERWTQLPRPKQLRKQLNAG